MSQNHTTIIEAAEIGTQVEMTSAKNIISFIKAGNAYFTIFFRNAGKHFTFRVAKSKKKKDSPFFVSLLTGGDNQSSYTYVGILGDYSGTLRLCGQKLSAEAESMKALAFLLSRLTTARTNNFTNGWERATPAHVEFLHMSACGRCGRALTTPESVHTGLGEYCARIMGKEWAA